MRRLRNGPLQSLAHGSRKILRATDRGQAYAILIHEGYFFRKEPLQQQHEPGHLMGGALPVLRGKGIEGQVTDSRLDACVRNLLDGLGALLMPL